jgi:hypothetical protein
MRRALVFALLVGLIGSGTAAAAPDNKNTDTFPVTCPAPIGTIQVTVNARSSSVTAFLPDGSVVVAKAFAGTETITVTGASFGTLTDTDSFSFSIGAQGKGHEGKLIPCTLTDSFGPVTFTLDAEEAAHLAEHFPAVDWSALVGTTITQSGTFTATVQVMLPGQ